MQDRTRGQAEAVGRRRPQTPVTTPSPVLYCTGAACPSYIYELTLRSNAGRESVGTYVFLKIGGPVSRGQGWGRLGQFQQHMVGGGVNHLVGGAAGSDAGLAAQATPVERGIAVSTLCCLMVAFWR